MRKDGDCGHKTYYDGPLVKENIPIWQGNETFLYFGIV
jgi:hypothetical protein